jgi:hypothetical protein
MADHVGGVVLFAGKLPSGITSHAEAYIDDAGDLVVEVQDLGRRVQELGRRVQELFGDHDYEWRIVVHAANKRRLRERLREQDDAAAAVPTTDSDAALLALIDHRFGGRPSAPSDLTDWLDANGIAYGRSSYA